MPKTKDRTEISYKIKLIFNGKHREINVSDFFFEQAADELA
jgi:hypothetical protein